MTTSERIISVIGLGYVGLPDFRRGDVLHSQADIGKAQRFFKLSADPYYRSVTGCGHGMVYTESSTIAVLKAR